MIGGSILSGTRGMPTAVQGDITQLLIAWREGDRQVVDGLVPSVYSELHRIAHGAIRRRPGERTLQTTALVNEAFVKLAESAGVSCRDRSHFLAMCAQLMRRILVDSARARLASKRGGGAWRVSFDEDAHGGSFTAAEMVRLDDALTALARSDPRKSQAIELRFFGGLSVEEAAAVLGISRETALRDWRFARAWLRNEMTGPNHHG